MLITKSCSFPRALIFEEGGVIQYWAVTWPFAVGSLLQYCSLEGKLSDLSQLMHQIFLPFCINNFYGAIIMVIEKVVDLSTVVISKNCNKGGSRCNHAHIFKDADMII